MLSFAFVALLFVVLNPPQSGHYACVEYSGYFVVTNTVMVTSSSRLTMVGRTIFALTQTFEA